MKAELLLVSAALAVGCASERLVEKPCFPDDPVPVAVTGKIDLFNGKDLSGWHTYLKGLGRDNDPEKVFTVKDGVLFISGKGPDGGIFTEKAYRDYRMTLEFRWAGKGWGGREHAAADSGLLFHSVGPDGLFSKTWMLSFEYNICIGEVGNTILVGRKDYPQALHCKARVDARNAWSPDGKVIELHNNGGVKTRFFPYNPPPDSENNPPVPPEKPYGEWNTIELVCDGTTAVYYLNGVKVSELFDLYPSGGRIQLQSEGHGIEYRNITLEPVR